VDAAGGPAAVAACSVRRMAAPARPELTALRGSAKLAARFGNMVGRVHASATYPLSTELFEISDSIRAIGSYRPDDSSAQER
jgi:hypothetical protein